MTNTQASEIMAELVAISRSVQRIAESCERAEQRAAAVTESADDANVEAQRPAIHTNITPPGTRGKGRAKR